MIRVLILACLLSAYAYSQYDEIELAHNDGARPARTYNPAEFLTPDVVPLSGTLPASSPASNTVPASGIAADQTSTDHNPENAAPLQEKQQDDSGLRFSNTGSPVQGMGASAAGNALACLQLGNTTSCMI